ncbi:MAG: serine protease [Bdellovibrionota bacterium]
MKVYKQLFIVQISLVSILTSFLIACSGSGPTETVELTNIDTPDVEGQVIYGEDGRRDLYQVTDVKLRTASQSIVSLFESANVIEQGARVSLKTESFAAAYSLCPTERFREQNLGAFCSGSLVGPDLVLTAGHCIRDVKACANVRFVFGFNVPVPGKQVSSVTSNDVYRCKSIVSRQENSSGADYAVIKLDRPVVGRKPLALNRKTLPKTGDPVLVIGHPTGLPLKVTLGGKVRSVANPNYFVTNLDTYGGNSGSAVFSTTTGLIEGILVRGENDFVPQGSCYVSYKCTETGCRGEDVTRVSKAAPFIPLIQ